MSVSEAIAGSTLTGLASRRLVGLIETHGWSWFGELENTEERLGDGTSGGASFTVLEFELDAGFEQVYKDVDSLEVLKDLVTEFELVYDEDEDDEDNLYELESLWRALRVDYHRSVGKLNTKVSRQKVSEELS